jgi:hypothetical protein
MGLPEVPPEQVAMSKQKLDRIHDALKQHVADGTLPGTVVLIARKGKLIYADVTGFQDKDEGKPMALDFVPNLFHDQAAGLGRGDHAGGGRNDPADRSGVEVLSRLQGPAGERGTQ